VNQAIETGTMWDSPTWHELLRHGRKGTLHLTGLHSDGNVYAIVRQAASQGVTRCRLHILLYGRNVGARSAQLYIEATEKVLAEINADHDVDFRIASGGGRMTITMDRYGADWPMVERGYNAHTHGIGRQFPTAAEAVDVFYEESDASDPKPKGDQYLDAFIVADDGEPIGVMADGDSVLLWNFRGDRAIEVSQAYESANFDAFDRGDHPDVYYAGLLQYDGDLGSRSLQLAVLVMFLSAGIYTVAILIRSRSMSMQIPFGPFMALGYVAGVLVAGPEAIV